MERTRAIIDKAKADAGYLDDDVRAPKRPARRPADEASERLTETHKLPWPVHPAAELYPMLEGDERSELARSIGANGQRHAVALWLDDDGTEWLIDGRNRALACLDAGVEIDAVRVEGSPWQYVLDANSHRRHLPAGQRASIALEILKGEQAWQQARAARQSRTTSVDSNPRNEPATTADALATKAKVSRQTAAKALSLERKDPKAHAEVAAGRRSLDSAYDEVKCSRKSPAEVYAGKLGKLADEAAAVAVGCGSAETRALVRRAAETIAAAFSS